MMNTLYYGDNLKIMGEHIADESVDLIYLDPPFSSSRNYNLLFQSPQGEQSHAQIVAFKDTWKWGLQAEKEYDEVMRSPNTNVAEMLAAVRRFLRENEMMAYLTMMARRLLELHRVLKPTGSLYLHCDPTASHYLKMLIDAVFGVLNFRNEIIWKRTSAHSDAKRYGAITDTIFFYTKSDQWTWNGHWQPHSEKHRRRFHRQDPDGRLWTDGDLSAKGLTGGGYKYIYKGAESLWRVPESRMRELDEQGRLHFTEKGGIRIKRYLDETAGRPLQNLWEDIPPLNSQSKERLGYPTQKPVALLERIIQVSSREGDTILDPFCGCGTAIHAAQKLNRHWIGIDITHLAISLIEKRMRDAFPDIIYEVIGTPKDVAGAQDLADRDKYQFQWWACSLVNAQPYQGKKKGADSGIDGLIFFKDIVNQKPITQKIVVSVKGGKSVGVAMIRELLATMEQNQAPIGAFISLTEPTSAMASEAAKAGYYTAGNGQPYPRLQLLTIEGLLSKRQRLEYIDFSYGSDTFKKAPRENSTNHTQDPLFE